MTLQQQQVKDLQEMESQLGNPTFTCNGITYSCVPSVSETTPELETGGFAVQRVLNMTVRQYDYSINSSTGTVILTPISSSFPGDAQVVYNGDTYYIRTIQKPPTQAYVRIMAVGEWEK
jgi:hypothetical protein